MNVANAGALTSRRVRLWTIGAAGIASVLLLSSCTTSSTGASGGGSGSSPASDSQAINTSSCPSSATTVAKGGTITLGSTIALTGPLGTTGVDLSKAAEAYFNKMNAQGGVQTVAGRKKIKLKVLDDAYTPSVSLTNAQQLVQQDHVFGIDVLFGPDSSLAMEPFLSQNCVPLLFFGGFIKPDPTKPWVSYQFPSFGEMGAAVVAHIHATDPHATVAVLSTTDSEGVAAYNAVKKEAAATGTKIVAAQAIDPNAVSAANQVTTLAASKADIFLNLSALNVCISSLDSMSTTSWKPTTYLLPGCGDTFVAQVHNPPAKLYSIIDQKSPALPAWASDPDMKEYTATMKAAGLPATSVTEDGWYIAELTELAFKDAKALTPASVAAAAITFPPTQIGLMLPGLKVQGWKTGVPIFTTFPLASWNPSVKTWNKPSGFLPAVPNS
jgi:branched-chain amino acid transport system substrate-binding protein